MEKHTYRHVCMDTHTKKQPKSHSEQLGPSYFCFDKDPPRWWRTGENEDTASSISPSTVMKYVFVLICPLIPSNPFHGPFPYANSWEGGGAVCEAPPAEKYLWGWLGVYITRFNWIVLHQCQEVSWCVCRGLCFFLTEGSVAPLTHPHPQQADAWLETKSFSGFNHRQSAREELGGSRHIKADWKQSYASRPCSKSAKATQ